MRTIVCAEFRHDIFNVALRCILGDRKLIGNQLVGISRSDQGQDLDFPLRQRDVRNAEVQRGVGRIGVTHAVDAHSSAIDYRGQNLNELDLDGLLLRRPKLVLVDELAHTNVPGSRHLKRWQDVLEVANRAWTADIYPYDDQMIKAANRMSSWPAAVTCPRWKLWPLWI